MRFLVLLLLAQDLSGNAGTSLQRTAPVQAYDEGVRQGRVYGVDCRGAGVTCQRDGGYLFMTIPGGSGGSGGKVAQAYMADASIVSQTAFSADASYTSQIASVSNVAYSADASYSSQFANVANVAFSSDASYISQIANVANTAYSADASFYSNQFIVNPTDCSGGQFANAIDSSGNLSCATPGGGSANSVQVSVSISGGAGFYSVTVTGQTWIASGTQIVCGLLGTTADGLTPEVIAISGITASVSNLVVGTGFNLNIFSPNQIEGTVRFECIGI